MNGSSAAVANSSAPIGGPMNSKERICTAYKRLLRRFEWSRRTTDGIIAWAALSKRVSPVPSANRDDAQERDTRRARPRSRQRGPRRSRRGRHRRLPITRRRSRRSTSAPLTRLGTSQGSRPARLTAATSAGSCVMVAASNGIATSRHAVAQRGDTGCGPDTASSGRRARTVGALSPARRAGSPPRARLRRRARAHPAGAAR